MPLGWRDGASGKHFGVSPSSPGFKSRDGHIAGSLKFAVGANILAVARNMGARTWECRQIRSLAFGHDVL